MISLRSAIGKRHSSLQQKALGASDRARRGKLGCVLAVLNSLVKLMFMAQSPDGAGEPALFIDGKFASTIPGEAKIIGVTAP
jgi:hypothetical protein